MGDPGESGRSRRLCMDCRAVSGHGVWIRLRDSKPARRMFARCCCQSRMHSEGGRDFPVCRQCGQARMPFPPLTVQTFLRVTWLVICGPTDIKYAGDEVNPKPFDSFVLVSGKLMKVTEIWKGVDPRLEKGQRRPACHVDRAGEIRETGGWLLRTDVTTYSPGPRQQ